MKRRAEGNVFYVYGLYKPDGSLFYVGKGFGDRMYDHVTDTHAGKCRNKHLERTIRKIEVAGGKVQYKKFIKDVSEPEAFAEEIRLIALYGRRTNKSGILVNISEGGQGSCGYRHTDEAKRKLSESSKGNTYRRGKKCTPEQCKRNSEAHKGLPSARKGATHTEEARAKIRAARARQVSPMKGMCHTEETKAKISSAKKGTTPWNKGLPTDPDHIAAMNNKWRGCKQTPETLRKISEASKAMWAKRREAKCLSI